MAKVRKGPTESDYREAAIDVHYDEGTLEVDDNAPISQAEGNPDEGAYVQAWIWVTDEEVARFKARLVERVELERVALRNRDR